jgi:hypothetical protein
VPLIVYSRTGCFLLLQRWCALRWLLRQLHQSSLLLLLLLLCCSH